LPGTTVITLTFPDGREVRQGELQEWLDMILADDTLTESQKDVARSLVTYVRIHSN
jgi:hypothetical protein